MLVVILAIHLVDATYDEAISGLSFMQPLDTCLTRPILPFFEFSGRGCNVNRFRYRS